VGAAPLIFIKSSPSGGFPDESPYIYINANTANSQEFPGYKSLVLNTSEMGEEAGVNWCGKLSRSRVPFKRADIFVWIDDREAAKAQRSRRAINRRSDRNSSHFGSPPATPDARVGAECGFQTRFAKPGVHQGRALPSSSS
jgi:hypothetical protein